MEGSPQAKFYRWEETDSVPVQALVGKKKKTVLMPRILKKRRRSSKTFVHRPIADKQAFVKLKLTHIRPDTSTAVALTAQSFQAKLNDPRSFAAWLTPSWDQPTGFDQWLTLYEKYTVYAVKIKVVVDNSSVGDVIMGMYPNTTATQFSNTTLNNYDYQSFENIASSPGGAVFFIGADGSVSSRIVYRKYFVLKSWFGNLWDDDAQSGTAGASPTNLFYWNWLYVQTGWGANAYNLFSRFKIKFYVKFTSPIVLGQS